jgi:hypothetical protein
MRRNTHYGNNFDPKSLKTLPPGSVYSEPGGHNHFAQTDTVQPTRTRNGPLNQPFIVESRGGRIWATPNSGRGATFYFTLPSSGSSMTSPAELRPRFGPPEE